MGDRQDMGVPASPSGHSPDGLSPSSLSQAEPSVPNAWPADFNEVYDNRPATPTRDKPIEVYVVGRRCVYVNNYRIAGAMPYVSEGLPSHALKTTLGDVLDAFTDREIRAVLRERKRRSDYFAAYHAARKARGEA